MPVSIEALGINRLTVRERLELIEQIWDSLPESVEPGEVPDWHLEELARRRAEEEAREETTTVSLIVEVDQEDDGRWLAEVPELPGVLAYGQNCSEAVSRVQAPALRVIADRLEHGEAVPDLTCVFSEVVRMSGAESNRVYHRLVILATRPDTDIWLEDDLGHFVQRGIGTLDTSLLPGDYAVEFGLGTTLYPIHLVEESRFTQAELAEGPTCTRRIPDLLDD